MLRTALFSFVCGLVLMVHGGCEPVDPIIVVVEPNTNEDPVVREPDVLEPILNDPRFIAALEAAQAAGVVLTPETRETGFALDAAYYAYEGEVMATSNGWDIGGSLVSIHIQVDQTIQGALYSDVEGSGGITRGDVEIRGKAAHFTLYSTTTNTFVGGGDDEVCGTITKIVFGSVDAANDTLTDVYMIDLYDLNTHNGACNMEIVVGDDAETGSWGVYYYGTMSRVNPKDFSIMRTQGKLIAGSDGRLSATASHAN